MSRAAVRSIGLSVAALCLACSDLGITVPSKTLPLIGKIAYAEGTALFVSDYDSNQLDRLVYAVPRFCCRFDWVVWAPNRKTLVFHYFLVALDQQGLPIVNRGLDSVNSDGSGATQLGVLGVPAFTADGKLAYSGCDAAVRCWIVVDGQQLYPAGDQASRPAFSPDGRFLVLSKNDTTSPGALYRVNLADKTSIPLVEGSGAYWDEVYINPIYSPEGDRIAYVKWGNAVAAGTSLEIWVMDADGVNRRRITSGHEDDWPTWSPDGAMIAFERVGETAAGVYVVKATGGDATSVIAGAASPSWRP